MTPIAPWRGLHLLFPTPKSWKLAPKFPRRWTKKGLGEGGITSGRCSWTSGLVLVAGDPPPRMPFLASHVNCCADSVTLCHCSFLSRWCYLSRGSVSQWSPSPRATITFYLSGSQSWQTWSVSSVRFTEPHSIISLDKNTITHYG